MSATTTSAAATPAGVLRRHRATLLVGLGAFAVLLVVSLLGIGGSAYGDPMDPENPGRAGAQALARVLDQQGVDVTVVRDQAALVDSDIDDATTVVVTSPDLLAPSTLERLQDEASDATALVIVGDAPTLSAVLDLELATVRAGERSAGCDLDLVSDLRVRVGVGALQADGCFGDGSGSVLVKQGTTWALSDPEVLTNRHIREADAAALGLRLMGQGERVVWYVPDLADADATEGFSLDRLLPRWLYPGLGLLAAAFVALVVWRARRLGPLVTEPLPVVVRAAESTHGRGRLYRRTSDRAHATAILAAATRRRLTTALALGHDVHPERLAAAVAERTGRDPREVLALLLPPPAPTNSALVTLGRRLTELENEVRP